MSELGKVSVLFNEPKLLKFDESVPASARVAGFSALQRAEIAEMYRSRYTRSHSVGFSALQRAEIAEISGLFAPLPDALGFSALQRAEIAEIVIILTWALREFAVSVLFNEPKLLKFQPVPRLADALGVSVLFNEPKLLKSEPVKCEIVNDLEFQCSSTSRNC